MRSAVIRQRDSPPDTAANLLRGLAADDARAGHDAAGAPGWHTYFADRRPGLYRRLIERDQPLV